MLETHFSYGKHALGILGACFVFVCSVLLPEIAHAEIIDSFIADIEVRKDSSFTVSEEITYTFDGERHGIFRYIPKLHSDGASSLFKERYIDITVTEVLEDGVPATVADIGNHNEVRLQIGDADKTITGTHVYRITYEVEGALSYEENGGAELYWDVTGNDWDVPITYAEARVSSPYPILLRERACYRGTDGEAHSCERVTEKEGTVIFSGNLFPPKHGLTIAQAVNRIQVPLDIRERYKPWLFLLLFLVTICIFVGTVLYRYKTKFDTDASIIPQYEPYPGVKPMYAGLLFDKRLDPRDITAGIVYLAEEGYLKIRKVEAKVFFFFEVDDYEIRVTRSTETLSGAFEKELFTLIFGTEDPEVETRITLRELKDNHAQARESMLLLQSLRTKLDDDLRAQGFYTRFGFRTLLTPQYVLGFLLVLALAVYLGGIAVGCLIVGLIILCIGLWGGQRTEKGYEALDHLRGFKDFLGVTDKDRFIFHNAPEKNAEQFLEYLPYAIAFGVEKEWAKTFKDISIPNPAWYDGGANTSAFGAVGLSESLGGFSTAFASTSASGSASSGGGSSGGGSGGGGGGSW